VRDALSGDTQDPNLGVFDPVIERATDLFDGRNLRFIDVGDN
jgi:hypothetical protein